MEKCENHVCDKELISKIYRELLKLNNKKANLIKNGQRTRHFSKKDT